MLNLEQINEIHRLAGGEHWSIRRIARQLRLAALVPGQAYCVAGKVNSADKFYLVIESVRPDTKHAWPSTAPLPTDGAGENPVA